MRAAAFGASVRGGEDKARCEEFVRPSISLAERGDAVESAREAGAIADDPGAGVHKAAKLRASRAREGGGDVRGLRRAVRLRCVIAQPRSDSMREHHRFQE